MFDNTILILSQQTKADDHETWRDTAQKSQVIHQVTTMLATSKNVLFPGHKHLLTTGTDDPSL